MVNHIKMLFAAHELLYTWVRREFKVRYSQSLLGAIWAIVQPLSLMVIFSLVFSLVLKVPTGEIPYPPFAYVGLLTWTLFSNALSFAIPSLVNNINLVSKIRFPREILPLAAILVSLIDFAIAALVFVDVASVSGTYQPTGAVCAGGVVSANLVHLRPGADYVHDIAGQLAVMAKEAGLPRTAEGLLQARSILEAEF